MPAKKAVRQSSETVSGQLRGIIASRGLTPYAVAQVADVAPSVVTRFVNGERGLSQESFDAVCTALGLRFTETRRGRPDGFEDATTGRRSTT